MASVSVTLVTYNSESFLEPCLESVWAQREVTPEIIVVDNASRDGTFKLLQRHAQRLRLIRNQENRGFAAAQNQAIQQTQGDWVLCLNPDVVLAPTFLKTLLEAASSYPCVGMLCGKLLRLPPDGSRPALSLLDSTGVYFTPTLRHLDRGSNEADYGQY
nr:glycosyltransferase [Anaerolineae bacterium]